MKGEDNGATVSRRASQERRSASAVLTCGSFSGESVGRTVSDDSERSLSGNVKELHTERDALNHIQTLRANINRDIAFSALMTFEALVDHYRQTELLADNKTEKTRATYLVYLRKWILPKWGREYLHDIKPVAVEQWLRSLDGLSNGSKAKIRNIMSGIFSHAIRYEMADKNPITAVRQSGKREKVPVILRRRGTASAI